MSPFHIFLLHHVFFRELFPFQNILCRPPVVGLKPIPRRHLSPRRPARRAPREARALGAGGAAGAAAPGRGGGGAAGRGDRAPRRVREFRGFRVFLGGFFGRKPWRTGDGGGEFFFGWGAETLARGEVGDGGGEFFFFLAETCALAERGDGGECFCFFWGGKWGGLVGVPFFFFVFLFFLRL